MVTRNINCRFLRGMRGIEAGAWEAAGKKMVPGLLARGKKVKRASLKKWPWRWFQFLPWATLGGGDKGHVEYLGLKQEKVWF